MIVPSRQAPTKVSLRVGDALTGKEEAMTILQDYMDKHQGSAQKYQEALGQFPSGVTHDNRFASPFPLYVTHGQGALKWDVDGNEYVDYVMGHGALLLGHSHPAVVAAVSEQMTKGTHLGANTEQEVRWADAIKALMPYVEKMRFHSSGTEATLMAFRLARAFTGKTKIIKLQDHFHGWHDYAMAGSDRGAPGIPASVWESMIIIPAGDLGAVQRALESDDDIAGLVLEPTGAHFGQLPLDLPDYLLGVRELTAKHGVLLIMDEVVTGFRIAPGGVQTLHGVRPDLTTLAKVAAGGLPGGAVAGRADIVDMMAFTGDPAHDSANRVYHPGTFNANPLSAAAGYTCLELLAQGNINQNANAMADRLKTGMNAILSKNEVAGHAHGIASIVQLVMDDCDCDRVICTMPHSQIKQAIAAPKVTALKRSLQNNGVDIMGRSALLVSGVHTEEQIDRTLESFERTLGEMRAEDAI